MKKICGEREMKNSFPLPDDIMIDIFLRLSIENLAQLRCVCKLWNELISSQSFVGFHLNRSINKPRLLFFRYGVSPSYLGFYSPKRQQFVNLRDPPFAMKLVDLDLLGSCNGVLCFCSSGFDRSLIYMWNPSINKYITLPKPSHNPRYLGFGVDSMSSHLDDFKVVTVSANTNAEVYSLRRKSWKIIADGFPRSIELNGSHISPPAFVNGSVHWCARVSCYLDSKCPWLIISFDFTKDVFQKIMLPDDLSTDDGAKYLNVLDGCLCVFATVHQPFRAYELWVMKEYGVKKSWTRKCIIEKAEKFWWPLGFTRKGKIFIRGDCEHCRNALLTYDPNTETFECLRFHLPFYSIQVLTFVESIINPVPQSVVMVRRS